MARDGTRRVENTETSGVAPVPALNTHGAGELLISLQGRASHEQASQSSHGRGGLTLGALACSNDHLVKKPRLAALIARRQSSRTPRDAASEQGAPNNFHYDQSSCSPGTTCPPRLSTSNLDHEWLRLPLPNVQDSIYSRDPLVDQSLPASPVPKRCPQGEPDYGRLNGDRDFNSHAPTSASRPERPPDEHGNSGPSICMVPHLEPSARPSHRGSAQWEAGAGNSNHLRLPQASSPSPWPSGNPGLLEDAVDPEQLTRIWGSRPEHDDNSGRSESGGEIRPPSDSHSCRMPAHTHEKVPLCWQGGGNADLETGGAIGYLGSARVRQMHGQSGRRFAGTVSSSLNLRGQPSPSVEKVERSSNVRGSTVGTQRVNYIDQDEWLQPGTETSNFGVGPANRQTHGEGDLPAATGFTDTQSATPASIFPSAPGAPIFSNPQTPTLTPELGARGCFRSVNNPPDLGIHRQGSGEGLELRGLGAKSPRSNDHSNVLASPRQLSENRALASGFGAGMASNSQRGTDRQEVASSVEKQELLSVQLSKMTTQEITEWMMKKERETRNRLRREGRDKGFRSEEVLLEYVNDRIEKPSKSDWPGLNKCPIEHALNVERKRGNRREKERGSLARHKRTDDTAQ